jgi:MFS family permease
MASRDPGAADDAGLRVTVVGRLALLSPMILACLALYTFGIALPKLAAAFAGAPHAMLLTQLVGAMVGLAFATGSPIAGRLADVHGYRVVYLWGAIGYAAAGVAGGLLDNLYLIIATRVLLGWSLAAVLVAAFKAVGMLPERERAAMYGFQSVVGSLLSMAAFPLVGWLASIDWRYPFFLYGVALLIVPLILGLPAGSPARAAAVSTMIGRRRLGGLSPRILLTALFLGIAIVVAPLFTPFYFAELGIVDPGRQALPMMMLGGVAVLCCGWFGWLYRRLTAAGVFALGFAGLAAGLLLASFAGGLATLCVAMGLASFGSSLLPSNLNAVAAEWRRGVRPGDRYRDRHILWGAGAVSVSRCCDQRAARRGSGVCDIRYRHVGRGGRLCAAVGRRTPAARGGRRGRSSAAHDN